jgi:tetratricopeptide (TPR) repeat protein
MRRVNRSISQMIALAVFLSFATCPSCAQEKKQLPIIYLRLLAPEAPNHATKLDQLKPNAGDVVVHELSRQAVLLAARDHGSLIIRDEGIGDPEPDAKDIPVHFFTMTGSYQPAKALELKLEGNKQLWNNHFDFDPQVHHIVQLTRYLEEKSRTELVSLLRKEIPSEQRASNQPKQINLKEMTTLLDDLSFLPQFEVLRRLHASSNQNDPKVLAALAQGYAQLAVLSRYHWTQLHRVCQARSLLYAQRLWAMHPKENGKSLFAVCLSLAGYHAIALKLYEEVEQAGEKLNPFAIAGKLASKMDHEALEQNGKKSEEPAAELSSYLAFRILAREPTFTLLGLNVPAQKSGLALVERNPEAYQVIHRLCTNNILGIRHQMTVAGQATLIRSLPKRLSAMAGMPDSVLRTLQDETMIRECHLALLKEGKSDTQEPSWGSVGTTILQIYFHQAYQRALFMHGGWSVPTNEYLEEVMPILVNHPHAVLVRLAGGDRNGVVGQQFVHPKAGDIRALELANVARPLLGEQNAVILLKRFQGQCPQTGDDLVLLNEFATEVPYRLALAKTLFKESPFHPMVSVNFMSSNPAEMESIIPDHAERFAKHVPYLFQFAEWKMRSNKLSEAEEALKKLIVMNPNSTSFTTLAKLYLRKNDHKRWEETLEAYLQTPDLGLQQATVRLELAEYHATQKNWEKAKKHASDAAETYAAWALFRASRVFELAGDLEKSEDLIIKMSMRYPEGAHQWLRWCVRNEKGDKDAAFKHVKSQIEQARRSDNMMLGVCLECMNQPKEAVAYYAKSYASEPHIQSSLRAAILEGDLGNTVARDEWMVKALSPNNRQGTDISFKVSLKVGDQILKAYRTETVPNIDIVETILEDMPVENKPFQYYMLGKVCEQLKNVEAAKRLYKLGLDTNAQGTWGWLLCHIRLRVLNR